MTNTNIPGDRLYSDDHEWVDVQSTTEIPAGAVRVGISRIAADNLGDLVFIDLPAVDSEITAEESCGEVESTKAVSELIAPVSGTVTDVNTAAVDDPTLVSTDPYGAGWLFEVRVSSLGPLMTAAEYTEKNGQSL
jgi:glycine cleavage system H protein